VSAIIFDCDGVLADTERYGHLPAFNQTFAEVGVPLQWSEEEYGRKLEIAGGKERMASELTPEFVRAITCRRSGGQGGAARRVAQAQDPDLHGDGGRRQAAAAAGHPADHR